MKTTHRWKTALGCVALAWSLVLQSAPSHAQERPLDAPRAAGLIGERYDGFAVVRDANAPADVRQLVDQTNAQRRQVYEQQAVSTGAPVGEVGKVYAAEILQKVPAGTWFQGADGRWMQK
ncbi:MAG: YdbL family protein [Gammaproteobacteria bacterium]